MMRRRAWERWRTGVCAAWMVCAGGWGGLASARPLGAQRGPSSAPPTAQSGPHSAAPAQSPPGTPLAFRGVTVIDVTTGAHRSNQTVVIVGNRIQAVGPVRTVRVPRGALRIDARGKYLIPGLWDMHIHTLFFAREEYVATYRRMLLAGITGFRTAAFNPNFGISLDSVHAWRRAILAGTMAGPPRQVIFLDVKGNEASVPAFDTTQFDSAKAAGADMLKTWGMTRAKYVQFARQARRVGLPFGGHVGPPADAARGAPDPGTMTAVELSDSGAVIVDHVGPAVSGGLDRLCVRNTQPAYQQATLAACRAAADRLRRNGTWWVPTLWEGVQVRPKVLEPNPQSVALIKGYTSRACGGGVRRDSAGILALASRAGMPLLAGTDVGAVGARNAGHEAALHWELALLVSEGLTPLAALQAATLNPARFLHATDSLGTVAPGKLADLVLLDDDPLTDITNTTHVRAVVANGRYFNGVPPCH